MFYFPVFFLDQFPSIKTRIYDTQGFQRERGRSCTCHKTIMAAFYLKQHHRHPLHPRASFGDKTGAAQQPSVSLQRGHLWGIGCRMQGGDDGSGSNQNQLRLFCATTTTTPWDEKPKCSIQSGFLHGVCPPRGLPRGWPPWRRTRSSSGSSGRSPGPPTLSVRPSECHRRGDPSVATHPNDHSMNRSVSGSMGVCASLFAV